MTKKECYVGQKVKVVSLEEIKRLQKEEKALSFVSGMSRFCNKTFTVNQIFGSAAKLKEEGLFYFDFDVLEPIENTKEITPGEIMELML